MFHPRILHWGLSTFFFGFFLLAAIPAAGVEELTGDEPLVSLEADQIRVRVAGRSGKIQFWNDAQERGSRKFTLEFNALREVLPGAELRPTTDTQTTSDTQVTSGTLAAHAFTSFSEQPFAFGPLEDDAFPGADAGTTVATKSVRFLAPLLVDEIATTLTVQVYLFMAPGTIRVDGQPFAVKRGYLKFTVDIEDWPFLAPENELVLELALKKFSAGAQPVAGKKNAFNLGDEGFLVLAETALKDGQPADIRSNVISAGQVTRILLAFPSFQNTLSYDPFLYSAYPAGTVPVKLSDFTLE